MAKRKKSIFILSLIASWQFASSAIFSAQAGTSVDAVPYLSGEPSTKSTSAASSVSTASADDKQHVISVTSQTVFHADEATIWNALINFLNYPVIFKRIDSVEVKRHEGNFIYVESNLKPHFFVKRVTQHLVNDLSAGPKVLKWRMLDGNFNNVAGKWELQPRSANTCVVRYTLSASPGAVIPAAIISMIVHHIQREVVEQLKHYVEAEFKNKLQSRGFINSAY